jgi:xanthine dehydrogenase accessory factor
MSTLFDVGLYERLDDEWRAGRPVVLATVIDRSGSVPREAGARMILWADGTAFGSVGGGCVEAEVRREARQLLLVTRRSTCVKLHLTERALGGTGDVCGGSMELILDYLSPEERDVGA